MDQLLLLVSWDSLISRHKKVNLQLGKEMCIFGSIYIDMIDNRQAREQLYNTGRISLS